MTPKRQLVREEVTSVQVLATNGYLGLLPGHAPLVAELGTGFMHYEAGGRRWYLAVHGGFLEVRADRVLVLANACERAEEIDVERARTAMERAQQEMQQASIGIDPAHALAAMASAQARLAAAAQKQGEHPAQP